MPWRFQPRLRPSRSPDVYRRQNRLSVQSQFRFPKGSALRIYPSTSLSSLHSLHRAQFSNRPATESQPTECRYVLRTAEAGRIQERRTSMAAPAVASSENLRRLRVVTSSSSRKELAK